MIKQLLLIFSLLITQISFAAPGSHQIPLLHAHINLHDKASLQRGARLFMNYCAGCHSLKYLRYSQMARGIGLTNSKGEIYTDLVKAHLIYPKTKLYAPIKPAMQSTAAKQWFGTLPPDLTLETARRGADWVYTYLMSFYRDHSRPFGDNNLLLPNTAMPNVLVNLQGTQILAFTNKNNKLNMFMCPK